MVEDKPKTPEGEKKPEGEPEAAKSLVSEANKAAERIEKANEETRKLVERAEAAKTQEILGGQSEAGNHPPAKTEEEKVAEEANAMLEGSGLAV